MGTILYPVQLEDIQRQVSYALLKVGVQESLEGSTHKNLEVRVIAPSLDSLAERLVTARLDAAVGHRPSHEKMIDQENYTCLDLNFKYESPIDTFMRTLPKHYEERASDRSNPFHRQWYHVKTLHPVDQEVFEVAVMEYLGKLIPTKPGPVVYHLSSPVVRG